MKTDPNKPVFPIRPFPPDHIFDPLQHFEFSDIHQRIRANHSGQSLDDIDLFFSKVSFLLRQVNSLSWLFHVWMKRFSSIGSVTREDMSMTVILLRMYWHIDTGKIFNAKKDRRDPNVVATRTDGHNLGYTGFSLDDFKCVKRDKTCSFKKRFAVVFKSWSYTTFDNVFLSPISGVCEAIYQSKFAYSNLYFTDPAMLSVS
jgi:hypothetical protein